MAKIEWTAEAESRLRGIYEYIAQDEPEAAMRLVEAIYRRTEVLSESAESGHRYWIAPAKTHSAVRPLLPGWRVSASDWTFAVSRGG